MHLKTKYIAKLVVMCLMVNTSKIHTDALRLNYLLFLIAR